jgi:hypothetical protein
LKQLFIIITILGLSHAAFSQEFQIKNVRLEDGKVILKYNLKDTIPGRRYTINLYSSEDDFVSPLSSVSGDIGLEIAPGSGKEIKWDAKSEYGSDFKGSLSLEVKGRLFVPFVRLEDLSTYKAFKRKKDYNITWVGGRGNQVLNFNLYKGEKKVTTYPNVANVGEYNLKFETDIKPGGNYYFKVEDSKNKDDVVLTQKFKIKRKVPLVLKLAPIAIVGGLVGYLVTSSDSSGTRTIPDPITPNSIQ